MKPTYGIEVNLEYNARQLSCSINSLKKIKTKLRNSELVLNDQPPKEEITATMEWKQRVHDLLHVHEKLDFPTFGEIRAEFDERSRVLAEQEERTMSSMHAFKLPPKSLEALKKSRELKRFGPCNFQFGPKQDGEIITEIKDYSGGNSYFRDTRPLIRKDYLGSAFSSQTSAPPWMGPQYYENTDPKLLQHKHAANINLSTGSRTGKTALEYKKEKMLHRSWSPHLAVSTSMPNFQKDSYCIRHEHQFSTPFDELQPFSRESARSTMGIKTPLSYGTSPRQIALGEKSMLQQMVGDGHGGTIALDVEVYDAPNSSLQTKLSRLGERVYQVKDYTMDGLAMQAKASTTYLTESFVPDEEDDLYSAGSGNKFNDVNKLFDDHSIGSKDESISISATSDTLSGLSADLFKVSNIDQAINEMAEIHGFTAADLSQESLGQQRELQAEMSMVDFREKNAQEFINYTREFRSRQASRRKRAVMITPTIPPVTEDMRSPIKKWFKQHKIYTPAKPQTIRYLKEHKSSAPVDVDGLLFADRDNAFQKSQIEEMITDLNIPSTYFALPLDMVGDTEPINPFARVPTSHSPHQQPPSLIGTRYCRPSSLTPINKYNSVISSEEAEEFEKELKAEKRKQGNKSKSMKSLRELKSSSSVIIDSFAVTMEIPLNDSIDLMNNLMLASPSLGDVVSVNESEHDVKGASAVIDKAVEEVLELPISTENAELALSTKATNEIIKESEVMEEIAVNVDEDRDDFEEYDDQDEASPKETGKTKTKTNAHKGKKGGKDEKKDKPKKKKGK